MRVEVVAHRPHDRVAQQHRVAHRPRGAGRARGGAAAASRRPGRPRRPGTAASRTRRAARPRATSSSISPVGEVRVDVALLAPHDLAGARRPRARAAAARRRVRLGGGLGVEDELHEPGAVAQVDEDQPAVVAAAVDPAGDARRSRRRARRRARRTRRRGSRSRAAASQRRPRDVVHDRVELHRLLLSRLHVLERTSRRRRGSQRSGRPRRSACLSWPLSERPPSSSLRRVARRGARRRRAGTPRRAARGSA